MNDYIYGGISGLCQTIIGYPLDTIKVKLQNNKNIKDLKLNKIMSGIKYPLRSSIFICSINFGSYNYMRNKLKLNIFDNFDEASHFIKKNRYLTFEESYKLYEA